MLKVGYWDRNHGLLTQEGGMSRSIAHAGVPQAKSVSLKEVMGEWWLL